MWWPSVVMSAGSKIFPGQATTPRTDRYSNTERCGPVDNNLPSNSLGSPICQVSTRAHCPTRRKVRDHSIGMAHFAM